MVEQLYDLSWGDHSTRTPVPEKHSSGHSDGGRSGSFVEGGRSMTQRETIREILKGGSSKGSEEVTMEPAEDNWAEAQASFTSHDLQSPEMWPFKPAGYRNTNRYQTKAASVFDEDFHLPDALHGRKNFDSGLLKDEEIFSPKARDGLNSPTSMHSGTYRRLGEEYGETPHHYMSYQDASRFFQGEWPNYQYFPGCMPCEYTSPNPPYVAAAADGGYIAGTDAYYYNEMDMYNATPPLIGGAPTTATAGPYEHYQEERERLPLRPTLLARMSLSELAGPFSPDRMSRTEAKFASSEPFKVQYPSSITSMKENLENNHESPMMSPLRPQPVELTTVSNKADATTPFPRGAKKDTPVYLGLNGKPSQADYLECGVDLRLSDLIQNQKSSDAKNEIQPDDTTLMLRNIPNKYGRDMLLQEINNKGFKDKYDFFYLPVDFRHRCNVGYAFINLISSEEAKRFQEKFDGFKLNAIKSTKVCETSRAKMQGQQANADQYRNSSVVRMAEKYHPLFFKDGVEIPFPPPLPRNDEGLVAMQLDSTNPAFAPTFQACATYGI